jgi:hypothetical protein
MLYREKSGNPGDTAESTYLSRVHEWREVVDEADTADGAKHKFWGKSGANVKITSPAVMGYLHSPTDI